MIKKLKLVLCISLITLPWASTYAIKIPQPASTEAISIAVDDAMQQHTNLNPVFFKNDGKIDPTVRTKLTNVSQEYFKDLESRLPGIRLKDIVFAGALAGYGYNEKSSDVDINILVDASKVQGGSVLVNNYLALLNKYWHKDNLVFDKGSMQITAVTAYAQAGNYSLLNDQWIKNPQHEKYQFSKAEVIKAVKDYDHKFIKLVQAYQQDPKHFDCARFKQITGELKNWRRKGLEREGASSLENVSYRAMNRLGLLEDDGSMTTLCRNGK